MHRHIEPALKAWQAAWASNPHHSKYFAKNSLNCQGRARLYFE